MAISIIKQPKKTVWSRNPVVFQVSTDNRYIQEGKEFLAELDFQEGAIDGYFFQLTWNGNNSIFTFKDTPDDSGLQIPTKQSEQTLLEWIEIVSNSLNSYFLFSDDFFISFKNGKIEIKSKLKKESMNVALIGSSAGLPMSLYIIDYAIDQILRENFALFVNLFLQDSEGNFNSFSRSVIEVDDQNKAIWDIQEYLTAGLLYPTEPRPPFETNLIHKESISARKFYLSFGEMFGYPQQMRQLKSTDHFTALLGGVDLEHEQKYSLPEFLQDGTINKWINNFPSKNILAQQRDYACIVNFGESIPIVKLEIFFFYPDNLVIKKEVEIGSWNTNVKLHIPVGIEAFSELLNEDIGLPISFSISIKNGTSRISNSSSYQIEHRFFPYSRIFLFMNSLGCYESIFSSGKSDISYAVEKNEKALEQSLERTVSEGNLKEIDISLRNEIKVNSGYMPKAEINKFRDFILSKSKYIFHEGAYRPIVLESNSINEFQDGNNLNAISFTVKFSNEQVLYSK